MWEKLYRCTFAKTVLSAVCCWFHAIVHVSGNKAAVLHAMKKPYYDDETAADYRNTLLINNTIILYNAFNSLNTAVVFVPIL